MLIIYLLIAGTLKPNFIKEANTLGMPVIARLPNNKLIWNFKGKYKTLNAIYDSFKNIRHNIAVNMERYLISISIQF